MKMRFLKGIVLNLLLEAHLRPIILRSFLILYRHVRLVEPSVTYALLSKFGSLGAIKFANIEFWSGDEAELKSLNLKFSYLGEHGLDSPFFSSSSIYS